MKILLLLITITSVSCVQKSEFITNGIIITKKELYLSRETNYKNEPVYFISKFKGLNTKPEDRIHTIGQINRGTVIPFNRIQQKSDLYIGNSTIYKGKFFYKGKLYYYKATFYDTDGNKYVQVILK